MSVSTSAEEKLDKIQKLVDLCRSGEINLQQLVIRISGVLD
jgi:hypothetical protein